MLLLKNLIFTLVVPGTVAGFVPYLVRRAEGGDIPATWGVMQIAGIGVAALGVGIYLRCVWDFMTAGRGTPAPIDPPKELVVRGLYRYVRNPMYVAVMCVLLGECLTLQSRALAIYAACVFLGFNAFIMLYEEPTLTRLFGDQYTRYRAEVPRWIPRLRAGR